MGCTKVCTHPQLPTTTHNHPQPPTTIHSHLQSPKNYPKKPKLVTVMLLHLDSNTEKEFDFDSRMKQYIYR